MNNFFLHLMASVSKYKLNIFNTKVGYAFFITSLVTKTFVVVFIVIAIRKKERRLLASSLFEHFELPATKTTRWKLAIWFLVMLWRGQNLMVIVCIEISTLPILHFKIKAMSFFGEKWAVVFWGKMSFLDYHTCKSVWNGFQRSKALHRFKAIFSVHKISQPNKVFRRVFNWK